MAHGEVAPLIAINRTFKCVSPSIASTVRRFNTESMWIRSQHLTAKRIGASRAQAFRRKRQVHPQRNGKPGISFRLVMSDNTMTSGKVKDEDESDRLREISRKVGEPDPSCEKSRFVPPDCLRLPARGTLTSRTILPAASQHNNVWHACMQCSNA